MTRRKTTEEFILEAKSIHGARYDYSLVKYVNNYTKIMIVCDEHGRFSQKPNDHLQAKGCQKCAGVARRTTETFIEDAKVIHGCRYDYSNVEYNTSLEKVSILCEKHGIFLQTPGNHLSGKGCFLCSAKIAHSNTEFIPKAKVIHGDRYDYADTKYIKCSIPVIIICKEHGAFHQTPSSHLQGAGCPKCRGFGKTTEDFVTESKIVHGDRYNYTLTNYVDALTKVDIVCSEHGIFRQAPSNHLRGAGCSRCVGFYKTTEDFIIEANLVHCNRFDYSKVVYVNSRTKISIVCSYHGEFIQTPSNHLSGIGCSKCADYGFNPSKPSIMYVYTFEDYVGFGITNNFKIRHRDHQLSFKKKGIDATLVATYNMSGDLAQSLEKHLKQTLPIVNAGIDGFKTEALNIDDLPILLDKIERLQGTYRDTNRNTKLLCTS